MEKMSMLQSSTQADYSCAVFCRSQANLLLKAVDHDFNAELYRVLGENGVVYYVWASINDVNSEIAYKPVFVGEEIPPIENFKPIAAGEAFEHCDNYYVTHLNSVGDLVIRRITVISNEQMLRQIFSDDEDYAEIDEIYLVKLYAIGKGKKFLTLAWGIVCEGSITYLPITDKDWQLFDEYSIGALLKERAAAGIPLKIHNKYFTPLHNSKSGWYLDCSTELCLIPKNG